MADPPGSAETAALDRGMRWASAGAGANVALGVASALVISRVYPPAVLGQFALAFACVTLLSQLSSLSEQAALVRVLSLEAPRSASGSGVALSTMGMSIVLTTVMAFVVAVAATLYLRHAADGAELVLPALVMLGGYLLIENLSWNLEAVLSAYRAAGALTVARLLQSAVLFAGSVGFAVLQRSVWALVGAYLLAAVTTLLWRAYHTRRYLRLRVPREDLRAGLRQLPSIVRFGLSVLPGSLAQGMTQQLSLWILGATAPVSVVGVYSRAQGITVRISDANYRFAAVMYPSFVRQSTLEGDGGLMSGVGRALRGPFTLVAIAMAAGAGAAHSALRLLGPEYVSAEGALSFLLAAAALGLADTIAGEALTARNSPRTASLGSIAGLVVAASIVVPLAGGHGATGAAAALCAGTATSAMVKFGALGRCTAGHWALRRVAWRAAGLAAGCASVFALMRTVQHHFGLPGVTAAGVVALAALIPLRRRARPMSAPESIAPAGSIRPTRPVVALSAVGAGADVMGNELTRNEIKEDER